MNNLQSKIFNATKWSAITEIVAKLITPITNIILARILVPEAFGVVATVTMIVSFADMLTDAGFQKYLIQHDFKNRTEKNKNATVAFWTNLFFSTLIWIIIFLCRDDLAILVGNEGLGNVLSIASLQLVLTAFSSIQIALFRRDFNFKALFLIRLITIFIPFIITIPLAFLGFSYWSIIIGTLLMQLTNAILLTIKSKWKPSFYYNFGILKEMFSFSIWSLIEAISIWLTTWVDTFIIGRLLSQHQVGLYKTSTTMINSLMSIVTSSVVPVLFSALSRLQDDVDKFNNLYFKFQRLVSIVVMPIGIGIYLYSELATTLFLGPQWEEASKIIGIWALTSSIMIIFGNFSSEVYRAKGMPKLSFFAQVLHLIVLIPTIIIAGQYSFWMLVYARSWIRLQFVLVHLILMKTFIKIPILKTFNNVTPSIIASVMMGGLGYSLQQINNGMVWDFLSILICIIFYFTIIFINPSHRKELIGILKSIKLKDKK
ncbi:lipopolysaccharide biosynthesis protein [Oceanobacillus kimchii]|uniref:lipopolysaccharide biosynthesis protein n=1 Tax=Oceanobacillus kimchii TaxID=746691 RepID=UPI003B022DDA